MLQNPQSLENNMRVTKRDGELEEIAFDKILNRIKNWDKKQTLILIIHRLL